MRVNQLLHLRVPNVSHNPLKHCQLVKWGSIVSVRFIVCLSHAHWNIYQGVTLAARSIRATGARCPTAPASATRPPHQASTRALFSAEPAALQSPAPLQQTELYTPH